MSKVQKFKIITQEMIDLYEAKNADYGDSFSKSNDEFGEVAGVIRLNDKLERLKSLMNKAPDVVNESKVDTLIDLANYAIMQIVWLQEQDQGENT